MVSEGGQQQAECKSELTGAISELESTGFKEKSDNRRGRGPVKTLSKARADEDEESSPPTAGHTHAFTPLRHPQGPRGTKTQHNNNTPLHGAQDASGKGHTLL